MNGLTGATIHLIALQPGGFYRLAIWRLAKNATAKQES